MIPHPPLRIAILECDTALPQTLLKYKRYGAISSALLESGAEAAGLRKGDVEIGIWDVVNEVGVFPKMEDVDGVFLTGSKFDSFADIPWTNKLVDYVKEILAQDRVRLVGVCFGHQIIGRAMGARVGRNDSQGWEVSVTDVDLTAEGKKFFDGKDVLSIYQMHKDIVFDYPHGVQPLGSTFRCKVQGMFVPQRVLTVQGHPEFTEEILVEILELRHQQGVFGDEIYREAMGRVGRGHDGLVVGRKFVEFLLER
ncbi:MAG: hypothetical protein LQ350_000256 [Teloschistes chrysophthalmus]|nr:MAG: hypothetical protein LQ350_000256 [Niorma chrysophthalma]